MKPDYSFLPGGDPNKPKPVEPKAEVTSVKSEEKQQITVSTPSVEKKSTVEVVPPPTSSGQPASTIAAAVTHAQNDNRTIDVKVGDRPTNSTIFTTTTSSNSGTFKPDVQVSFSDSLAKSSKADVDDRKMGVVTDMSDLDVWGPEKTEKPRTVQIAKDAGQKTVSLVGLDAAGVATKSHGVATSKDEGAPEDEEQLQMVIQNPDGSYQVVEGEEAARLMQQATAGECEFLEPGDAQQAAITQGFFLIILFASMSRIDSDSFYSHNSGIRKRFKRSWSSDNGGHAAVS